MIPRASQLVLSRFAILSSALVCVFATGMSHAAYISEIDLNGPAGQGIELSQVDPHLDYTLLILDASTASSFSFGTVLDVINMPAGIGLVNVAMVTDSAWPDTTAQTTPLASLSSAANSETLLLDQTRLLVVMQGQSTVQRFDNPVNGDLVMQARYDTAAVTDWLVLGHGDLHAAYQTNGHDLTAINAALGIDLPNRLIDKDDTRIIARTKMPNGDLNMDVFFTGDPDASLQFDVDLGDGYRYTYTPSQLNTPLIPVPEPNTLVLLAMAGVACLRRRR